MAELDINTTSIGELAMLIVIKRKLNYIDDLLVNFELMKVKQEIESTLTYVTDLIESRDNG